MLSNLAGSVRSKARGDILHISEQSANTKLYKRHSVTVPLNKRATHSLVIVNSTQQFSRYKERKWLNLKKVNFLFTIV